MLVWFVYMTQYQRATAQSCAAVLSRNKIAGVTYYKQVRWYGKCGMQNAPEDKNSWKLHFC